MFAAEWDPTLNLLYRNNFDIPVWSDINELDAPSTIEQAVPDHDVLTAGFPCQPFSKAGEQLGFEHTLQGQLFFRVLDILRVKTPRRFILENVPNILRHRGGATLETIKLELESLGYSVDVRSFSPHQFGIPQIRERAYIVGSSEGLDEFEWPVPSMEKTDITSILSSSAEVLRAIPEQTSRAIDMWDDFLNRSPRATKLPSFPIWAMEFRANYPYVDGTPAALWQEKGPRELDGFAGSFGASLTALSRSAQFALLPSHSRRKGDFVFPKWKQTFIRQNRDFYEANKKWIDPWLDEWEPWRYPSSFQKFEWNAQGGARQIDDYVLQIRASGIRVKRTSTAPSLIAMTQTQVPILGKNIVGTRRYMSPTECARLQSLDTISLPGSDIHAYKALGNAVNSRVVSEIAKPLLGTLLSSNSQASHAIAAA